MCLAVAADKHLVQMPAPVRPVAPVYALPPDLASDHRSKTIRLFGVSTSWTDWAGRIRDRSSSSLSERREHGCRGGSVFREQTMTAAPRYRDGTGWLRACCFMKGWSDRREKDVFPRGTGLGRADGVRTEHEGEYSSQWSAIVSIARETKCRWEHSVRCGDVRKSLGNQGWRSPVRPSSAEGLDSVAS